MNCSSTHCVGNEAGACRVFALDKPGPCREFELREGAECQHKRAVGQQYHGPYGLELCPECLATRKYCDATVWRDGQAFGGGVSYDPWRPYPQGWADLERAFGPQTVAEMLGQVPASEHCPHI